MTPNVTRHQTNKLCFLQNDLQMVPEPTDTYVPELLNLDTQVLEVLPASALKSEKDRLLKEAGLTGTQTQDPANAKVEPKLKAENEEDDLEGPVNKAKPKGRAKAKAKGPAKDTVEPKLEAESEEGDEPAARPNWVNLKKNLLKENIIGLKKVKNEFLNNLLKNKRERKMKL